MDFEKKYMKHKNRNVVGPITKQKQTENDGTKVTIICVTYNHEKFIAQALESFLMQKTNFKFKVFVGDDCSQDGTAKIVEKYANKYPDIIIPFLRKQNIGSKNNLLDLINNSNSKYICFCDGDDYWVDEYKLQIQYDFMEKNNSLAGCYGKTEILAPKDWYLNFYFKVCKDGKRYIPDSIPKYKYMEEIGAKDIIPLHPLHTSSVFLRWDYDIKIPEWYFYGFFGDIPLFLLQIGKSKIGYIDRVVSVYRRSDVGVHFFKNKEQHFLKTRFEFINYLLGIKEYYKSLDKDFAISLIPIIDKRINNEISSYLRVAKKEKNILAFLKIFIKFPMSMKVFSRKINEKAYYTLKNNFKNLFEKLFSKYISNGMKEAFLTLGYKNYDYNLKRNVWSKFITDVEDKKVIFLGFGPAVWELGPHRINVNSINCIVDPSASSGETRKFRNIPIYGLRYLENFDDTKYVILIAYTNNAQIRLALNILNQLKIDNYYSYAYMESQIFRNKCIKHFYLFYRYVRLWCLPNGLFNNLLLFNINACVRKISSHIFPKQYESLSKLKNSMNSQRCFIIGNGPSLNVEDLELLNNETTFAVNNIYTIFPKTNWRPTYYAICDINAYETTLEYFQKIGNDVIPWRDFAKERLFLPQKLSNIVNCDIVEFVNISYLDQHINADTDFFLYSKDLIYGVYNLRTVVNFCINIAHYMGFKEIYLLGVDCNYSGAVQYFDGSKNILLQNNNGLLNMTRAVMLEQGMKNAYEYVKNEVEKEGVKIFNASRSSKLDVFKKVKLENILNKKEK